MRQTKKRNEWRFGMKAHIGVDAETGMVHSVTTTPANAHDVTEAHRLLHGGEKRVLCDAGYQGVDKRMENRELEVAWLVAMRPGQRRKLEPGGVEALEEKRKASVGAKVEHPFLYVKRRFGYAKLRCRGLAQKHATAGVAAGAGQPDNGRAPSGHVTWAERLQITAESEDSCQRSRFESKTAPI